MTTNLETGGTYTAVFTPNSRDHTIVDNGDGTITITVFASGNSPYYDATGKLVLRDSGHFRFAFDIDYNGTPGDPSDDVEVDDLSGLSAPPPVTATLRSATSHGPGGVTSWAKPINPLAVFR